MGKTYRKEKTAERISKRVNTHRDLPDVYDVYDEEEGLLEEEEYFWYEKQLRPEEEPSRSSKD